MDLFSNWICFNPRSWICFSAQAQPVGAGEAGPGQGDEQGGGGRAGGRIHHPQRPAGQVRVHPLQGQGVQAEALHDPAPPLRPLPHLLPPLRALPRHLPVRHAVQGAPGGAQEGRGEGGGGGAEAAEQPGGEGAGRVPHRHHLHLPGASRGEGGGGELLPGEGEAAQDSLRVQALRLHGGHPGQDVQPLPQAPPEDPPVQVRPVRRAFPDGPRHQAALPEGPRDKAADQHEAGGAGGEGRQLRELGDGLPRGGGPVQPPYGAPEGRQDLRQPGQDHQGPLHDLQRVERAARV